MESALPLEELAFQRLKVMVYSYTLFAKNLMEAGVEFDTVKKASDKTWAMLGQQTARQFKPLYGENAGLENLQHSAAMVAGVHGMNMTEKISGNTIESRYTRCAWQDVNLALNLPEDWRLCQSGHTAFAKSMYKGLNPDADYELAEKMPSGDHICVGKTTL